MVDSPKPSKGLLRCQRVRLGKYLASGALDSGLISSSKGLKELVRLRKDVLAGVPIAASAPSLKGLKGEESDCRRDDKYCSILSEMSVICSGLGDWIMPRT